MRIQTGAALPPPAFEGVEKRVEIDFRQTLPGAPGSLRHVPKARWDQLLAPAECTIVSERGNAHCTAYVLSESSLFVYARKVVLKTCGTTKLLAAVPGILADAALQGLDACGCKYTRANFRCPAAQPGVHQTFDREVEALKGLFGHLGDGGDAHVLGSLTKGARWHVFAVGDAAAREARQAGPGGALHTLEVCMNDLDPECARHFFAAAGDGTAEGVTKASGIAGLLPHADFVDAYLFDPCGYSMNSLEGAGLCTIHITPEADCSYASVEFSGYAPHELNPSKVVGAVAEIFKPKALSAALYTEEAAGEANVSWTRPLALKGYAAAVSVSQAGGSNGATFFHTFARHGAGAPRPTAPVPEQEALDVIRLGSPTSTDSEEPEADKYGSARAAEGSLPPKRQCVARVADAGLEGLEGLTVLPVDSSQPVAVDAVARRLIAAEHLEDNFYICDLGNVERRFAVWRQLLPRVKPCYAVKCNPDRGFLATLARLGAGFDCASELELAAVLALGVSPEDVVFANACKRPCDLRYIARVGADLTTFDTACELEKIAELHPRAKCLLRIRADDPGARCQLGNKYGAELPEVPRLLQLAKGLGLCVSGVSFHVGSGASDPHAFEKAIAAARTVFDQAKQLGLGSLEVLDIGGGFSGGSGDGHAELRPVAEAINSALDRHFPAGAGVAVIAEPGRYFSEAAATLATQVFGVRRRPAGMDYWITDGLYGSMNCVLYDHAVLSARTLRVVPAKPAPDGAAVRPSTVFGPTCDGLDTVLTDVELPLLSRGDWLLFPSMGAYTVSAGSDFNGIEASKARVFYVCSREA